MSTLEPGPLRLWLFMAVFAIARLGGAAETNQAIPSLAEFQQRLSNHVTQPKFDSAVWGVKVISLDSGKVIFEHQAQKLLSPASNSKLYTVAAALDRLGPDYRIATSLYGLSKPNDQGVLQGDLIVYGRGDPTLNARLHGRDLYAALESLGSSLTNSGVKEIAGNLVADESFFTGPPYGSGWTWDDPQYYYGAEISPLSIEDNTLVVSVAPGEKAGDPCRIELIRPVKLPSPQAPAEQGRPAPPDPFSSYIVLSNRTETIEQGRRSLSFHRSLEENTIYISGRMPVGSEPFREDITVHHPAGLFLACLRVVLEQKGVRIQGTNCAPGWPARKGQRSGCENAVELGRVESPPFSEIAREIQKPSQNLYTDLILAHLGEKRRRTPNNPDSTSEDLGIEELQAFLRQAGVGRREVIFEEGSGLSRNNLTTANATVRLLQYMDQHSHRDIFVNALPVAGVDGTLRSRLKGTPAAGNLRAKTGTLRWANSLSGYVTTAAGERLAFSLMLNRYSSADSDRSARTELDDIAVMMASLGEKTASP